MYIFYGIFFMAGIILMVFSALPHGKGLIPLHPIYGRLAGLLMVIAGILRFFKIVIHRTLSDDISFVLIASLGLFFLVVSMIAYKVRRRW